MKCSTDFQERNQGFVCKQCVNMYFCCSDVVCLTDLRPPWICCFYWSGHTKSFPKTPWQQQIPHSVFYLNEQFLHHLFEWNCTKTNHQLILLLYEETSKSLKKSPIIFQWGNIPAFQLLCQTKTSLCHLPKRVSMCWYNRHVVVQNWRELG